MTRTRMRMVSPVLVLLLLFAFVFLPMADARAESGSAEIKLNERLQVALTAEGVSVTFTASTNSVYVFQSFGGQGASARLYEGGRTEPIASGEGFVFSARLVADRKYSLHVSGQAGEAYIEIMRDALGRSFERPLELRDILSGYSKVVARANDVHWYRFVPQQSGLYMIATRSAMDTFGVLTDAGGEQIAASDGAYAPHTGNFRLQVQLSAGKAYMLRVSAMGDSIGRYQLRFIRAGEDARLPDVLTLDSEQLHLLDGGHARLTARVSPEGALNEIMWVSSDPRVVQVSESGVVTATGVGEAEIRALAFGDLSATCRVQVDEIPVESLQFEEESVSLPVGEQLPLRVQVLPKDASKPDARFESEDPRVAFVDDAGNLLAVRIGQTQIIAKSGQATARLPVTVTETPPKHRALVMGEQRYLDGRIRLGSVNSTQGIADMLREQDYGGSGYEVTMRMDSTSAEAIAAIRLAFGEAQARDTSLFYINCHGLIEDGMPYLEFYDGSRLSARALERELRKVPGTVVVIIDCCNSGSFVSREQARSFSGGVVSAFGMNHTGAFALSKYRVICSSGATQDSHRIAFNGKMNEASMITVLANALCEAGGWNPMKGAPMSMRADGNKNREVTLEEAYRYAYTRVKSSIRGEGSGKLSQVRTDQDVQVFPRGSQFVLFSKSK